MPSSAPDAENRLCCVAIPLLAQDIGPNLATTFGIWEDDRFLPRTYHAENRPRLLIVMNNGSDAEKQKAEELFRAHPRIVSCFSGVTVENAELHGDADVYVRDSTQPRGRFGNKAGPNHLFQKTMQFAARYGGWTMQLELDCLPVEADWLDATQRVIDGGTRSWVIGTLFSGRSGIDRAFQTHLNGNALYKTGDPEFQTFLASIWLPSITKLSLHWPNLAYDCWWSLQCYLADASKGNSFWDLFQTYGSFFRYDPFIVNLLVEPSGAGEYITQFQRFASIGRSPVFFHGPAIKPLLRTLLLNRQDNLLTAIDRVASAERTVTSPVSPAPDFGCLPPQVIVPSVLPEGDFISQLVARSSKGDADAARQLLVCFASALVMEPSTAVKREVEDSALSDALRKSLDSQESALAAHFRRAQAYARNATGGKSGSGYRDSRHSAPAPGD